ncbi:MAG: RluA family pseudouridine synthase [Bacteroidia bacterium]
MSNNDNNNEEEGLGYVQYSFTVDQKQEPLRIDKFLVNRITNATRSRIQQAISQSQVLVNGTVVKANYKIRPQDQIEVRVDELPNELLIKPEALHIDIVYEDDDLMIVNKKAGMVVHPGVGNHSGTLVNALAHYFNVEVDFEGKRPWLVHRIDKNTSGLLVIAKNDQAMSHLAAQFKDHSISRKYVALVWGDFEEEEGTISTYIARDQYDRKRYTAVEEEGERGKWAVTHYSVLEDFLFCSLIECRLETGRTHQIRVHMRHIGHSLFNDEMYGGNKILKGVVFSKYKQFVDNCFMILPRQALHAKSLGFVHPTTGKEMFFVSELPPDFEEVIQKWRTVHQSSSFQ